MTTEPISHLWAMIAVAEQIIVIVVHNIVTMGIVKVLVCWYMVQLEHSHIWYRVDRVKSLRNSICVPDI